MIVRILTPIACAIGVLGMGVSAGAASEEEAPRLLDARAFAPERVIAPPPAPGSAVATEELRFLSRLHAAASTDRVARAARDGKDKTPHAFNDAAGRDLQALPATTALLRIVKQETGAVVRAGQAYFHRTRPYVADPGLAHCDNGNGTDDSYPSGHAAFAWSTGWTLAQLMPDRAPALLERARDYADGREICAVHYPSDVEAGHALGTLVADHLLHDPRLADQVAAARRELAQR